MGRWEEKPNSKLLLEDKDPIGGVGGLRRASPFGGPFEDSPFIEGLSGRLKGSGRSSPAVEPNTFYSTRVEGWGQSDGLLNKSPIHSREIWL